MDQHIAPNKTDIVKKVKNRCLIEVLRKSGFALHTSSCEVRSTLIMYLHNKLGDEWDSYEDFEKCVKGKIEGFCSTVNKKWKESNRCMSKFLVKNEKWLQLEFNIPCIAKNEIGCQPSTSRGRPSKSFFDLSERSKRRKTEYLRKTTTSEVLICAAKNTLYSEGKRAAAQMLSQITEYSPRRAIKIKNIYKIGSSKTVMPYK